MGLPDFMKYPPDPLVPTTSREFLAEVRNNSDIWKKCPEECRVIERFGSAPDLR